MGLLNRDDLLKKEKVKIVKVELDDDNFVFVRQMSGRERDRWEASMLREGPGGKYQQALDDFRAKLAAATLCDEEGNLLLRPGDIGTLSQNMSAASLDRIVTKAQEINRVSEQDKEALVKNSGVGLADNSGSDSVEN
jgi:hypothetical protein